MRVRKHANPFNFPRELPKLQMDKIFKDNSAPLHLEIGFAQGEFLLGMATKNTKQNFLGIEVRKPLVEKLQESIISNNLSNIAAIYASSNVNIDILPDHSIEKIYIFFPDPWFKKKHFKRRIITPVFLETIQFKLKDNCHILFQTDVKSLYLDTLESINNNANYKVNYTQEEAVNVNETGITSYFELRCQQKKWPIYRINFVYNSID